MTALVCYCFKYTEEDIRKDFEVNGRSTILEKIWEEKSSAIASAPSKTPRAADAWPTFARW